MTAPSPPEMDSLLREIAAVLRQAYLLGRADALRDAASLLAAEAAASSGSAAANDQARQGAPASQRRRKAPSASAAPLE